MNTSPLILKNESKLNNDDIQTLFEIFKEDFITNTTVLNINGAHYTITVKPDNKCNCPFTGENKPERFWHVITTKENDIKKRNNPCPEDREKNRIYCSSRAKRIHWIKQTIDNSSDEDIKYFFEDNGNPTHFLWDQKRHYIVLIKHLGNSDNLLVTAHLVYKNKYRDFKQKLEEYERRQRG